MNTKPVFFLCFLCALLLISVVATEPSKDETQAEEPKTQPDAWGRGGSGGHDGSWGHGGDWGHGGGGHGGGHGGGCRCCGRKGCKCC
ncbi:hypothetical protein GLYMA_14G052902v4 [Glycine max]|uniref:glycine-rich protein DOT1 isoform X1 n=1 Tax=Glycine max TaxID=3847 RepID=UPI00023D33BF|nr:glycine-rich protein DOT1 isoform X1 [Glycine max]XP_028198649.1 glycine-rich protein DOT1-like isoform X3 [Glycine soja]KAG4382293.1 hypothetical protein GLYMA_14G052902v4 [Glycine max]|eukprot:XP_003545632.2 glycine-rich protein DOT1 isoform X1 [Glycine max]